MASPPNARPSPQQHPEDQIKNLMPAMLAKLEKDLQECIQELLGMSDSARLLAEKEELQTDIGRNLSYLRAKMRMLRRWRNGTEEYGETEAAQLSTFIGKSQLRIHEAKIMQLVLHLTYIDEVIDEQGLMDEAMLQSRQDIDCLLPVLQERLKSVDGETETLQCVTGFKEDLREIQTMVLALRTRLGKPPKNIRSSFFRSSAIRRPHSLSSPSQCKRIEDHPLVNDLLRMVGKIRRLLTCFQNGYHEPTEGSIPCVDNDIDVLHRQLDKLNKWRTCEKDFTKSELEDMDLIVSAMSRHLRSDISLDSVSSCEDREKFELSPCNRGSRTSSGGSQSSSRSLSSGSVELSEHKTADSNSTEDEMLDERLI